MKARLVFLHLLDHTTTNCTQSWVEVFFRSVEFPPATYKTIKLVKTLKKLILR